MKIAAFGYIATLVFGLMFGLPTDNNQVSIAYAAPHDLCSNQALNKRFIRPMRLVYQLDLSLDQQVNVDTIIDDSRLRARELREEASSYRKALVALARVGDEGYDQLLTQADVLGAVMAELAVEKARALGEIYLDVLTSEQQVQLDELLQCYFNEDLARR